MRVCVGLPHDLFIGTAALSVARLESVGCVCVCVSARVGGWVLRQEIRGDHDHSHNKWLFNISMCREIKRVRRIEGEGRWGRGERWGEEGQKSQKSVMNKTKGENMCRVKPNRVTTAFAHVAMCLIVN